MRTNVPAYMDDLWQNATFTGARKAMARVVIQHIDVALSELGYNLYSSLVFGSQSRTPMEAPNVQSVSWQRSVDTEIATCTVTFYNTAEVPIGDDVGFTQDVRGYYSFDRGTTDFSQRWQAIPNEWQGMLVPDNILYTYEGYGFDSTVIPEKDPNLCLTGMWIIDSVEYNTNGLITVKCSDLLRILRDQICFVPVVPSNFYPVQFSFSPSAAGFDSGAFVAGSWEDYPPGDGPAIQSIGSAGAGPGEVAISWTIDPGVDPDAIFGYLIAFDGVIQQNVVYTELSATVKHLIDGNVYDFEIIPLYKELGKLNTLLAKVTAAMTNVTNAETTFGIDSKAYSDAVAALGVARAAYNRQLALPVPVTMGARNPELILNGSPRGSSIAGILAGSVQANSGAPATLGGVTTTVQGDISFCYVTGTPDSFEIVVELLGKRYVFEADPADTITIDFPGFGAQNGIIVSTGLGDLSDAKILVYPICSDGIGFGGIYRPSGTTQITYRPSLSAPAVGQPSSPASAPSSSTVGNTATGKVSPISVNQIVPGYSADSGGYTQTHTVVAGDTLAGLAQSFLGSTTKASVIYNANKTIIDAGATAHGGAVASRPLYPGEVLTIPLVYGHSPGDAFDGSAASYWLSGGRDLPTQADSFVWIEAECNGEEVTSVVFDTVKGTYQVYLSVFAEGHWVQYRAGETVPYEPGTVAKDNGARVPYVLTAPQPDGEGPWSLDLPKPIPGVTKVRLTFTNLAQFEVGDPAGGDLLWRAAVREIALAVVPGSAFTGTNSSSSTTTYSSSDQGSDGSSTYQQPPQVTTAGTTPGQYHDYTDIVKLFCAWGGFFWPAGSTRVLSDGSVVPYPIGIYDQILGGDAGRVWGDFMDTGTAGIAALPIPQWDKKSLLDCINYVQQVIGFLFCCDETGGVVWRLPNVYSVGNYLGDVAGGGLYSANDIVTIDENNTLIELSAVLDATNLRERFFVATTDGTIGGLSQGYNPNPIGLRRVGGWTDQHFASNSEAQLMADFIALRALMAYRQDTLTVPGYPRIQIDDQVKIFEQVTNEGYLHYVRGISSNLNMESGEYTYQLTTNWLGSRPFDLWIFDPAQMSAELQAYLNAVLGGIGMYPTPPISAPEGPSAPTSNPTPIPVPRLPWRLTRPMNPGEYYSYVYVPNQEDAGLVPLSYSDWYDANPDLVNQIIEQDLTYYYQHGGGPQSGGGPVLGG